MTIDDYVEQDFPIECKGRSPSGNEVLREAIEVKVKIYKRPGSSIISSEVQCPYNTGAHGEECRASNLHDAGCPYAFDLPYDLEKK